NIAATFKNLTTTQRLGSANLAPPPGYSVQSIASFSRPAPATATAVDGVVQLRSLSLAPQASATVTMSVLTPCSPPATAEWNAIAKQANDFNGTGNDLALDPALSSVTTTTFGACEPCPENEVCDTELGGAGKSLSLLSHPDPNQVDEGLLTISPSALLDCAVYSERGTTTFRFDAPQNRGKVGTLTYTSGSNVTSKDPLEVCFGAPFAFAVKPKTQRTTTTIDGQFLYVGRLPNCLGLTPPPCVTSREDKLRRITFRMSPGDPYSR
ncbi:MAG TPA: hypothetical protein VNA28_09360, partial [Solirubrobacteraceae bacterium]|nr:hypothetical protein [Solirubrobacteraceae bacterium]